MINPQAIPRAYKRVEEISTRNETLGASLQCGGRQRALSPSHSGMSVRWFFLCLAGPDITAAGAFVSFAPRSLFPGPHHKKSSWTEIALGRGKHTLDECRHSQKILSERTAQHSKAREAGACARCKDARVPTNKFLKASSHSPFLFSDSPVSASDGF